MYLIRIIFNLLDGMVAGEWWTSMMELCLSFSGFEFDLGDTTFSEAFGSPVNK